MEGDADFWYSDFIKRYASSFILEDSGFYKLNTTAAGHGMLSLLNQDGVFKVNGEIMIHKRNVVKVITDGDDSKLELLGGITESNKKLGVVVLNNNGYDNNSRSAFSLQAIGVGAQGRNTCENRNGNSRGSDRVTAELLVDNFVNYDKEWYEPLYTAGLISVNTTNWGKDGLFGGWTRKRTSALRVQGNVIINYTFESGEIYRFVNATQDRLITRYNVIIWRSGITYDYEEDILDVSLSARGSLIVYGRGGTSCGDVTDPNSTWR